MNHHQILDIFKKKKIVIANVFPKLQTVKDLVRPLSKKRCLRTSFESQHVKGSQTLPKNAWENFCRTFSWLLEEMICNISPSLKFNILWVFVNTLTDDDKYPVQERENFIVLYWKVILKTKSFVWIFCSFFWICIKF